MPEFVTIAKVGDVAPGKGKRVKSGVKEIALFNVDGQYHATSNFCVHEGGPIGDGELEGKMVSCPWHGWDYDVTTGICGFNPNARLKSYVVKVEGNEIKVEL